LRHKPQTAAAAALCITDSAGVQRIDFYFAATGGWVGLGTNVSRWRGFSVRHL